MDCQANSIVKFPSGRKQSQRVWCYPVKNYRGSSSTRVVSLHSCNPFWVDTKKGWIWNMKSGLKACKRGAIAWHFYSTCTHTVLHYSIFGILYIFCWKKVTVAILRCCKQSPAPPDVRSATNNIKTCSQGVLSSFGNSNSKHANELQNVQYDSEGKYPEWPDSW